MISVTSNLLVYNRQLPLQMRWSEAVKIYGSQATIVLNSNAEWHQPNIDRVLVRRAASEEDWRRKKEERRISQLLPSWQAGP